MQSGGCTLLSEVKAKAVNLAHAQGSARSGSHKHKEPNKMRASYVGLRGRPQFEFLQNLLFLCAALRYLFLYTEYR